MKNRNWYGKCPNPDIRFTTRASTRAYPIVTGRGSYRASLFQFILDNANAARLVSSHGPWPACRTRGIGRSVLRAPWKYDPADALGVAMHPEKAFPRPQSEHRTAGDGECGWFALL